MTKYTAWLLSLILITQTSTTLADYPTSYWITDQVGEVYELQYGDGTTNTTMMKLFETNKLGANEFCDLDGSNCFGAATVASLAAGSGGKFTDGTNTADAVFTGGSVGIGTMVPAQKLHVEGNIQVGSAGSSTYTDFRVLRNVSDIDETAFMGILGAGNPNEGYTIVGSSSNGVGFTADVSGTSVTPDMVISKAGNVGIGTTTPSGLLHVEGDEAGVVSSRVVNTGTDATSRAMSFVNSGGNGQDVFMQAAGANFDVGLEMLGSSTGVVAAGGGLTNGLNIGSSASAPLRFFNGGYAAVNEHMRIDANGNVGIGITTPSEKLHVNGNVLIDNNSSQAIFRMVNDTDDSFQVLSNSVGVAMVRENGRITMDADQAVEASVGQFTLAENGNVGIGTSNPNHKLDVLGSPNSSGLRVFSPAGGSYFSNEIRFADDITGGSLFNLRSDNTAGSASRAQLMISGETDAANHRMGIGIETDAQVAYIETGALSDGSTPMPLSLGVGGISGRSNDLYIDSTGNVGIGTTSPTEKLDVDGNVKAVAFIGDGSQLTNLPAGGKFVDGTDSSYAVYTGGAVGIGIETPEKILHVQGGSGGPDELLYVESEDSVVSLGLADSTGSAKVQSIGGQLQFFTGGAAGSFATGATQNMTINQHGNVGIGTISPTEALEVQASTGSSYIKVNPQADNAYGGIKVVGKLGGEENEASVYASYNGSLNFDTPREYQMKTNGTEVLRISNAGNVGIGTTTPSTTLDIVSSSAAPIKVFRDSSNASLQVSNSVGDVYFGTNVSGNAAIGHSASQALAPLQVTSSGSVGIGTTTPSATLDINKSAGATSLRLRSEDDAALFRIQAPHTEDASLTIGTTAGGYIGSIGKTGSTFAIDYNGANNGGDLWFRNNGGTTVMALDGTTGNVGMGTTGPTEKLEVVGNVKVSSLAGAHAGGSAFVCVDTAGVLYASEVACP